jgi:signal peptidase I
MPHLFSPSWLKKADRFSKGVKKFIAYQRDLIPPAKMQEVQEAKTAYDAALKAKDREALDAQEKKLLKVCENAVPDYSASPLKENVEVIIVAVIVALGIRAYFLQPFKIPTASMQPTLNGIIAERFDPGETSPNFLLQAWQYAWNGRNYVNVIIPQEWGKTQLVGFRQYSKINFFTFTELRFANNQTLTAYAPARQLFRTLCWNEELRRVGPSNSDDSPPGRWIELGRLGVTADWRPAGGAWQPEVNGGDVFARGHVESGDQLLVDKVSYHFRRPARDEVFVFSTKDITAIGKDQHYIKRLTALPGDRLAVEQPCLYINGEVATGRGAKRVMSMQDGYGGYTRPAQPSPGDFVRYSDGPRSDEVTLGVFDDGARRGERQYMAMGDNSADSLDSRMWGPVPEKNLVGPALFVYWPFANHWGMIR